MNRTRGFPRCEIRQVGDKEKPRERCEGETENKKKKEEKDDGKRKDGGEIDRRRACGGRRREEGELGDVGKEEANQKRKYALARPEALRRYSRPRSF